MSDHLKEPYDTVQNRLLQSLVDYIEDRWSDDFCMKHRSAEKPLEEYQAQIGIIEDFTDEVVRRVVGACKTAYKRVAKLRNAFCPINTLPAEILGYIFQLAGEYGAKHTTNLRLSTTCSRWRAVQLNNPSAWSSFYPAPPTNYVELAMRRNGHVPLYIYLGRRTMTRPVLFRIAQEHLSRLHTLHLGFNRGDDLEGLLGASAPQMENLMLQSSAEPQPTVQCTLDAPNLRELTLHHCMLALRSPLTKFEKLTKITVEMRTGRTFDNLTDHILNLMRATPRLQDLDVRCNLPDTPWSDSQIAPPPERVEVTSLVRFVIKLPLALSVHLLSSIALPSGLDKFHVTTTNHQSSRLRQLWTTACLPAHLFFNLIGVEMRLSATHNIIFDGSRTTDSLDPDYYNDVCINFSLPQDTTSGWAEDCMAPVVSYVLDNPMPNIRSLDVWNPLTRSLMVTNDITFRTISTHLHSLLLHFSNIAALFIRLNSTRTFENLHAYLLNAIPPIFPSLDSLTVQVTSYVPLDTLLSFARQLVPDNLQTLHLAGMIVETDNFAAAERFICNDLPALAREVWVTNSTMFVDGRVHEFDSERFWPGDSEFPLKIGDSSAMREL